LKSASYTNVQNEERFYQQRIGFFKYLYAISEKYNKSINNWIDFGCSYGHFLQFLTEKGITCTGIEIDDGTRGLASENGLIVYKTLQELPQSSTFQIISLIDSLYFSLTPKLLLQSLHRILDDRGLIIIRLTNRNWLAKIRKRISGSDLGYSLGDATISYSKRSITYLLEKTGFEILKITHTEKGKSVSRKMSLYYLVSSLLYRISLGLVNFTPGMIIIARKKRQ
jgi:2-polyprenyl-3-methyl-5-hydroxy-6-metoxy-1,4-benzoquinol methylase